MKTTTKILFTIILLFFINVTVVKASDATCVYKVKNSIPPWSGADNITVKCDGTQSAYFVSPSQGFTIEKQWYITCSSMSDGYDKLMCPSLWVSLYDNASTAGLEYQISFLETPQPGTTLSNEIFPSPESVVNNDDSTSTPTQNGSNGTSEPINCNDFDTENGNLLKEIYDIMVIAGPILVIIFGTMDFGKAALNSDNDAMKKAVKHFSKRLIALTILLLLPVLVNFILDLATGAGIFGGNIPTPDICVR